METTENSSNSKRLCTTFPSKEELIKLNLRGQVFITTPKTILESSFDPENLFATSIKYADKMSTIICDGAYFFDRNPSNMSAILDWLSNGIVPKQPNEEMIEDFLYFALTGLVNTVNEIKKSASISTLCYSVAEFSDIEKISYEEMVIINSTESVVLSGFSDLVKRQFASGTMAKIRFVFMIPRDFSDLAKKVVLENDPLRKDYAPSSTHVIILCQGKSTVIVSKSQMGIDELLVKITEESKFTNYVYRK
jgi:hypothetical protein